MKWKFRKDRPIYAQLIEQLERGILMGVYPPGSAVPSVRALAVEAEVNPNTMQKALAELEARGLMQTHRTSGRTVTEDMDMIGKMKEDLARNLIHEFFSGMNSIGIGSGDAKKMIASVRIEAGPDRSSGENNEEVI
jgi:DNA-binding transcriptional regulator YhcF (GntR family)